MLAVNGQPELNYTHDSERLAQEMYWDMVTQGAGLLLDGYFGSDNGTLAVQMDIMQEHYRLPENGGYPQDVLARACQRAREMRLEGRV